MFITIFPNASLTLLSLTVAVSLLLQMNIVAKGSHQKECNNFFFFVVDSTLALCNKKECNLLALFIGKY